MNYEAELEQLGLEIPKPPQPVAVYVPAITVGNLVFTSGQIPVSGGVMRYQGKVGAELSQDQGYAAAQLCALNCLSVLKGQLGSLNRIDRIVKLTGYVNSAPGFTGQSQVINGASELLGKVFGENGHHARAAVGVSELPLDAAVEIEMIVRVKERQE